MNTVLENRYTSRIPPAIPSRRGRLAAAAFTLGCALPFGAASAREATPWANEISAQHAIVDVADSASMPPTSNGIVTLTENEDRAAQVIRATPVPVGSNKAVGTPDTSAITRRNASDDAATIDNGVRNAQRIIRDDHTRDPASPTIAPVAGAANSCHLEVAYAPVLIRLAANEFRVAFGVSREGCEAGCSGYINYDAIWTNEDQSVGRASRSLGFAFPRNAIGTIALDRQVFDSGAAAHTTKIVDVIPREVGCTSVVVSR